MGYNANFSKAVCLRDVPTTALIKYLKEIVGKPEEEKQRLMNQFAREIETTYPYVEERKAAGYEKL